MAIYFRNIPAVVIVGAFLLSHIHSFQFARHTHLVHPNQVRSTRQVFLSETHKFTRLYGYSSSPEEKPGLSFKVIAIGLVGLFGVFGTSFVGTIQSTVKDVVSEQSSGSTLKNSAGESSNRGAMTRLTRKEINNKLSQVPIFFAANNDGGIFVENSVGLIFVEKSDADAFAKIHSLKVSATSLDSIFYTLIEKKTKLGSFVEGVSAKSDPLASYKLVLTKAELVNVPKGWESTHIDDIPLFRVPKLAFSKNEGLELPLFLRKDDAINAFERLQKSVVGESESTEIKIPDLQVTSLFDIVQIFSTGGFEGRALEIYPSMNSVEEARNIMFPSE